MPYVPVPLPDRMNFPDPEMRTRADAFYDEIRRRHTVRDFSSRPVPSCLLAEGARRSGL